MDWKYPVTFLDNEQVSIMKGGQFAEFRNKVNKMIKAKTRFFDQNSMEYEERVMEIDAMITKWASSVSAQKNFDIEHLVSSNRHGYLMGLKKLKNFQSLVFDTGGDIVALYTSEVLPNQTTANGITLCIDLEIPGSSEFAYYTTCKRHFELGFDTTNINGAETLKLDEFRQKLNPIKKFEIKTFRYKSFR